MRWLPVVGDTYSVWIQKAVYMWMDGFLFSRYFCCLDTEEKVLKYSVDEVASCCWGYFWTLKPVRHGDWWLLFTGILLLFEYRRK
jgi:hypothetical protein